MSFSQHQLGLLIAILRVVDTGPYEPMRVELLERLERELRDRHGLRLQSPSPIL